MSDIEVIQTEAGKQIEHRGIREHEWNRSK